MATIQNARDVLLQAAATRLETVAGPTNVTTDFANVTGSTRPSNNADVTQTAVNSGVTASSGGITLSSGGAIKGGQTAYDSGNGFFLGYTGSAYKFSVGNSSGNKFTWDGSTLGIVGDISGTSNIDITGNARFKGAYTGAVTNAAVYANESNTAATGVFGTSSATLASHAATGVGVWGVGTGAEAIGVIGFSNGSIGVSGASSSASAAGVRANNSGGGPSLESVTTFKWSSYTFAVPAGSTSTYMRNDGTWSNPVTTSAVNSAFGASESDVCQLVATDSGTATVAGSGFNLNCTVSGVQTVGSGNTVVIQTISDARLKQDIEDETLGLDFIAQLRPRTYRMRSNPALRYHGFIYQEVAELMRDDTPDALALHRPGSYGGVDYMSLVAPLVLAVQQLAARVQQLESA